VRIEAPRFIPETSAPSPGDNRGSKSIQQQQEERTSGSGGDRCLSSTASNWSATTPSYQRTNSSNDKSSTSSRADIQSADSPLAMSSNDKPPVVLKFGKQDNGTYYKKDVSVTTSSTAGSLSTGQLQSQHQQQQSTSSTSASLTSMVRQDKEKNNKKDKKADLVVRKNPILKD